VSAWTPREVTCSRSPVGRAFMPAPKGTVRALSVGKTNNDNFVITIRFWLLTGTTSRFGVSTSDNAQSQMIPGRSPYSAWRRSAAQLVDGGRRHACQVGRSPWRHCSRPTGLHQWIRTGRRRRLRSVEREQQSPDRDEIVGRRLLRERDSQHGGCSCPSFEAQGPCSPPSVGHTYWSVDVVHVSVRLREDSWLHLLVVSLPGRTVVRNDSVEDGLERRRPAGSTSPKLVIGNGALGCRDMGRASRRFPARLARLRAGRA
jgi:hypothetical protein